MGPQGFDGPIAYVDRPDLIHDDDYVYRRIRPGAVDWSKLDSVGRPNINKNAFSDLAEEEARRLGCPGRAMSVSVESIMVARELAPREYLLAKLPGYGLVRIRAGVLRAIGAQGLQPWPTDEDVSHAVVFSTKPGATKRSAGDERRTRNAAEWVCIPERLPEQAP